MAWVTAAEKLPVWAEVQVDPPALSSGGESTSEEFSPGTAQQSVSDLFVVQPLPSQQSSSSEDRFLVIVVKSQVADNFQNLACSEVTLQLGVVQDPGSSPSESESMTLHVEVPGYDIRRDGHFRQVQVCASGRGVLLVAPKCCAGVVVPAFDDPNATAEVHLRATPLVPPDGIEIIKVLWHPLSDAHIAMLLSDSTWQLLNIAHRVAIVDPEVSIKVTFDGKCEHGEYCSDFSFGLSSALASPSSSRSDHVWLAVTVFFLSSTGKISYCSPILPSLSVFPTAMLEALRTSSDGAHDEVPGSRLDGYEWLSRTLLCTANRRSVPLPGAAPDTFRSVRHSLHLHGDSETYFRRWTPSEQYIAEAQTDCEEASRSPRSLGSPRDHVGKYCSVQIVSHFPVVVVARATTTGLVDFLILSGAISPEFERRDSCGNAKRVSLSCVVFEEADLEITPSKANVVRLSMAPSVESSSTAILLARSRALVAAIELPWIASLRAGAVEELPSTAITTLLEIKAADGPCEFVGWQLVSARNGCIGLGLQVQEGSSKGTGKMKSVNVHQLVEGVRKVKLSKEAPAIKNTKSSSPDVALAPEREDHLRFFSSMVIPSRLFGNASSDAPELPTASTIANKIAAVQEGQVAALSAKQEFLKKLAAQAPERMKKTMAEVEEVRKTGEDIRRRTEATNRHVKNIRERQSKLEEKYHALTETLRSQVEYHSLDRVAAQDLPRLWSQLHELRQSFELLRAAAAPQNPQEIASRNANWLSQVEHLQYTWTQSTTDSLREQVVEAEKLVASAAARLGHEGHLTIVN